MSNSLKMKELWSNPEYKKKVSLKIKESYKRPEVIEKHNKSRIGHIVTQDTKDKISLANTGKKRSEETIEKRRKINLGKHHSEETKQKMSMSQKNRLRTNEDIERIRNLGFKNKGRKFTEEHRKKLSDSHKGQITWCKGLTKETDERLLRISNNNKGKILSEETKIKIGLVHKGNKYRLGKKLSEETKDKIRLSHLGKKQSLESIRKRMDKLRGENHYNWKGGITPITRKRTRGIEWKRIADEVRLRDNNTCRNCGLIRESKLPVHHIIPFRISKDNSLNNLITLCNHCHKVFEDRIKDLGYRELAYKLIENNPIQVKLRSLQ